ncbi:MAG: phospholipase D family protein [bacterium]|nr:phospholipase D family protein [bacterium]
MAKVELLIQSLTSTGSQKDAIIKLLDYKNIKRFIACSAFVREDGVKTIISHLKKIGSISTAYVGIRNGITSIQGLIALLKSGITIHVIDTGSLSILYHPKIYCAFNDSNALTLIGSTNLTFPGLVNNIESSALIDLNLQDDNDNIFNVMRNNFHGNPP